MGVVAKKGHGGPLNGSTAKDQYTGGIAKFRRPVRGRMISRNLSAFAGLFCRSAPLRRAPEEVFVSWRRGMVGKLCGLE